MKRKVSNQNTNKNSEKKAELRKLVLAQLSKVRKKMQREHPGMLEGLKEKIEEKNRADKTPTKSEPQKSEVEIDQQKNREAIEKMLSLKTDNPGFEKAVKTILSKQKH